MDNGALPEERLEERANEVRPYPPCLVETERDACVNGSDDLDESKFISNAIENLRWSIMAIEVNGTRSVTMLRRWVEKLCVVHSFWRHMDFPQLIHNRVYKYMH